MPKRILLIGVLFCLGGLSAIWDVLSGLSESRLNLNFAVFLLPVGIGLLRGKRRSLGWARFWIILGYVLCGVLAVGAVVSPGSVHATWFGTKLQGPAAAPYVIGLALSCAGLLFAVHRLLYSEKANRFFRSPRAAAGQEDAQAAAQELRPRPFQFRLRTLLIVTAVVALALVLFLPDVRPSPLFDQARSAFFFRNQTTDPVEKALGKIVPAKAVHGLSGSQGGGSGNTVSSYKLCYTRDAQILCSPEFADQMMHKLRTELKRRVEDIGARIADETQEVKESKLTAFRFSYADRFHRGTVKVAIKLGCRVEPDCMKELVALDPSWAFPEQELHWEVEELAGRGL